MAAGLSVTTVTVKYIAAILVIIILTIRKKGLKLSIIRGFSLLGHN